MTATFGDLARRADEHLAAALGDLDGRLAVSGNCLRTGEAAAAATEIGRISATLSSYLVLGNRARGTTHPWAESVGIVGSELQHAAQALHGLDGGHAGGGGVDGTVPMAGHLAATSQALAHGHDLLASHHPGRGDAALARSLWAESITSPPVMAALLAEIGGWSSQLALLSSCIAYDVWDVPASTRRAMRAATIRFNAAMTEIYAVTGHPPMSAYRELLHAIPAAGSPARRPPGGPESVPGLCEGIIVSAERIRATLASPARDGATPASAEDLMLTTQACAVAGHCSELILDALAARAATLFRGPADTFLQSAAVSVHTISSYEFRLQRNGSHIRPTRDAPAWVCRFSQIHLQGYPPLWGGR